MTTKRINIVLFILPTLLLFLIVYGASLIILCYTSLTQWNIGLKPEYIGLQNYISMFTNDKIFKVSLINTLVWILLQSTIHVAIGITLALILTKKEFYWKFTRTVFMIPNIISGAAIGMLFICILSPEVGAVNNIIRLIGFRDFSVNWFMDYSTAFFSVTMTWLPYAAVTMILVLAEIASIPESLFEAAKIDGSSNFQVNMYITLPMLRNIIGTSVIICATSMVQKLDIIAVTTGGGPGSTTMNLPMYIYRTALIDNNFGYANAVGFFLILLGIIVVLSIQKIFKMGESNV